MNLNPTLRWLLTGLAAAVTALGGLIAAGTITDLPSWVGVVVSVLSATLAALNIVPPQTGGTQQGVVNPAVTEPPAMEPPDPGKERL